MLDMYRSIPARHDDASLTLRQTGKVRGPSHLPAPFCLQIQADLGEGHVNIVNAKEVLLTEFHLALVLEYASRGTLTAYVAEHWHHGQQHGLYLTEDEARYLFRVQPVCLLSLRTA